ncbi:hypothetical protein S83_038644, partial [Arachis hypogaea]
YFGLGEVVDRMLLNHLLKIFTALGIYAESFEKPFLECAYEFHTRLQEKHNRCLIYLDASTRKPLIATAKKQLLERHIPAILDK